MNRLSPVGLIVVLILIIPIALTYAVYGISTGLEGWFIIAALVAATVVTFAIMVGKRRNRGERR